jgi:hypothetical protein
MASPRKSRTAGETKNKKQKDSKGLKPVKNNGMLLAHYGLELDTSGGMSPVGYAYFKKCSVTAGDAPRSRCSSGRLASRPLIFCIERRNKT